MEQQRFEVEPGRYIAWPMSVPTAIKQPTRRWRRCSYCMVRRARADQQFCRECIAQGQERFGATSRP